MSLLQIKNLTVELEGHLILKDVNFNVDKGDFYAIIGPNGGGKSVLLKTILGLIKATKGEVLVNEQKIEVGRKHVLGYVPQFIHYDINFPITALEVAMMGKMRLKGLGRAFSDKDFQFVKDKLSQVGLEDHIYKKSFSTLSGGQRQRVLIARALASEAEILLLDEPTASVDSQVLPDIYNLFSKLNREGKTILIVTHDTGMLSKHITKIACLNKTLHTHNDKHLSPDLVIKTYGCDIEALGHGIPHRVLGNH